MRSDLIRYAVAFALVLGLIFLVLMLLFDHGSSSKTPANKPLISYATTDAEARLTIDGPINADQNHRSVTVTVDSSEVVFQRFQGYQGTVINSQTFANNESAYTNFLAALTYAGFTEGNNNPNMNDELGACSTGDRYIFELTQDGQDIERYWATSCGGSKTYKGNVNLTIYLFQAQVPGYSGLVSS